MTKNLAAISELKEALDGLFELSRDITVLAKYGVSGILTTELQQLVTRGKSILQKLESQT